MSVHRARFAALVAVGSVAVGAVAVLLAPAAQAGTGYVSVRVENASGRVLKSTQALDLGGPVRIREPAVAGESKVVVNNETGQSLTVATAGEPTQIVPRHSVRSLPSLTSVLVLSR